MLRAWEVSDDGLLYTLHFRDDLIWSDGSRFSAEDVATAIRYQVKKAHSSTALSLYEKVARKTRPAGEPDLEVLNPETLQIHMQRPDPLFMGRLTIGNASALKASQLEKYGDQWHQLDNLLTLSPYRIKENRLPEALLLEKFTAFPGAERLHWDQVHLHFIPKSEERLRALQSGAVDIVRIDEFTNNMGDSERLPGKILLSRRPNTRYIELNPGRTFSHDPRIREAFALLVDRFDPDAQPPHCWNNRCIPLFRTNWMNITRYSSCHRLRPVNNALPGPAHC
ncbi:MAG: ABC transporter substrate-binding protein [Thiolinea sp.]